MNRNRTRTYKTLAGLAGLALVAVPLAACGEEDSADSGSSSNESSQTQKVEATAEIAALTGDNTAVKLDAGFVQALTDLKLKPGVAGDAKLEGGDTLVFPITGGNVSLFEPGSVPNYVVGQVQHEGSALTLSAGGTTVEIGNFNVDPGVSVVYGDVSANGKPVVSSVPIFDLNGSTLQPIKQEGGATVLQGSEVMMSAPAADLLNQTFKTDAIKPGLLVGVATITAK
jgi:hypothetical protein